MTRSLQELSNQEILISPSVLAADFANLESEVKRVTTAEMLHLDVMDGHFVPNISYGVPVIQSLRDKTDMLFDAHLMISHPQKYIEVFAKAGADNITVHIESDGDVNEWIKQIRDAGCTVGLSVKPGTPASAVIPYLNEIDMVLIMTVEPGFGGQKFMSDMMPKVREIRAAIKETGRNVHIQVDGGVSVETAPTVIEAGANSLVAGTAVFKYEDGADVAISKMKSNKHLLS